MVLALKLMLIILLNKTYPLLTQDSEIVLLPAWNPTGAKEISLTLKVFGILIQLNLHRNDQFVLPAFKIWEYNTNNVTEKLSKLKTSDSCFYIHENDVSSAAINICQKHGLEGLIFVKNDILEIRPLWNMFTLLSFIDNSCVRQQINQSFGTLHLVKKLQRHFASLDLYNTYKIRSKRRPIEQKERYTIKLFVIVDVTARHMFMSLFNNNISYINNLMYRYVDNMQYFFSRPSLGVYIDIVLKDIQIMSAPLPNFSNDGNIKEQLDVFCDFITPFNPPNNDNPDHWDIALYVSGINLYALKKTSGLRYTYKDYGVSGRSYPDGACKLYLSCAIIELLRHEVYLSGSISILSSLNAVYQIGILLGLREVSNKGSDLYIMSPERSYSDNITWSPQSRNMIKQQLKTKICLQDHQLEKGEIEKYDDDDILSTFAFDNSHYGNYPGRKQTAKAQCELFLRDKDANVVTLHDICKNLKCETPRKIESYFAGSALNGTHCALRKECYGGECVPIIEPPYNFKYCEVDRWSKWREDSCKSGCLVKSKGVRVRRRSCEHRTKRAVDCSGPYYDVNLCNDSLRCIEKRKSIAEFVTMKCTEFNKVAKKVDTVELPIEKFQFTHDVEKLWKACTVYCRQKETPDWDASRQEMLDHGINPYFPDGTWCHNENGTNYYCRQHYCLSEIVSSVNANF